MTIQCHDEISFLDTIASLVSRGLGFRADAGKFLITLTGAF